METDEGIIEKTNVPILMVGLDNTGKTTLLYKLKNGNEGIIKTIPTLGYNVESVESEDKKYTFWDIGGSDTVRVLWKFYAENKAVVVFVVDASSSNRFEEAKQFLHTIMDYKVLHNANLLIVSNKHDKPNCSSDEELIDKLDLKSLKQTVRIVNTSAFDFQSLNNIMVQLKDVTLFK